jgi:hypothetical protein
MLMMQEMWSRDSAEVDGIKRWELNAAPCPAWVAEKLNALMERSPFAFCDGGESDARWLFQQYETAGIGSRLGVRQLPPVVDRWLAGISARSRSRACHCRRHSEPVAGGRRPVATNASAAISFGG